MQVFVVNSTHGMPHPQLCRQLFTEGAFVVNARVWLIPHFLDAIVRTVGLAVVAWIPILRSIIFSLI
jgi:hypothetical protein